MSRQKDRRKFLKQMAQFAITSTLSTHYFFETHRAWGGSGLKRRHFVNLIASGGWDSSWHHNTFSSVHLLEHPDAKVSFSPYGFDFEHRHKTYRYTSKCSSTDETELGTHPTGARLGPAMASAMLTSDWSRTLIWKGLTHPGFHGNNNRYILQGNTSTYAISSSGLISAALAQVERKPLHYVLMNQDPADLFTQLAMAEDAAVPICLGGLTDFATFTSRNTDEPTDAGVLAEIQATVEKLTVDVLAKRAKQASSQAVARAYGASLEGTQAVYGSNLSTDPELLYLKKYYFQEGLKSLGGLIDIGGMRDRANSIKHPANSALTYRDLLQGFKDAVSFYSLIPLTFEAYQASPSSFNLGDINTNPSTVPSICWSNEKAIGRLRSQAATYALADFLIRRNLSAVVDVPGWQGMIDAHGGTDENYMEELVSMHISQSLFFAMQRSFQSISVPEQGGTLLDCTLIALHTEFDRFAYHETIGDTDALKTDKSAVRAGTNHSNSASLMLAGYNIAGGRVVGGVHEGPGMLTSFSRINYLDPLPIDPNTGAVSSSGSLINILSIAPTLVDAFGTTLPPQQVTEYPLVPAVLNKTG
jgi:hypothetical protein